MTVVPFSSTHITALAAIEQQCFSTPWSYDALAEELTNPLARFLVAEENGQVIGYVGCLFIAEEGDITNVAVHPAHRRKGVASTLLSALFHCASDAGITAIHLEVRASNTAAIALYEAHGYRKDGVRPHFYSAPVEDAVLYTLHIEENGNANIGN